MVSLLVCSLFRLGRRLRNRRSLRELRRGVGGSVCFPLVFFQYGQGGLVASQGVFEGVAQVDEDMIAISNLLGTRSAAFGSLRIGSCPVTADQLHRAGAYAQGAKRGAPRAKQIRSEE